MLICCSPLSPVPTPPLIFLRARDECMSQTTALILGVWRENCQIRCVKVAYTPTAVRRCKGEAQARKRQMRSNRSMKR